MASPFGGIDPSILALFNQGPSDEEKKAARQHALLAAGLSMMQSNQRPLQAAGAGGLLGMGVYHNQLGDAAHARSQGLQQMNQALQLQNAFDARNQHASAMGVINANPQQPGPVGMGPPLPDSSMSMQPPPSGLPPKMPTKMEQANYYQGLGDKLAAQGLDDYAQKYYDRAEKTRPKLKDTKPYTDKQTGQRVLVKEYEDGTHEVVPDLGPDKEKLDIRNNGGTTQGYNVYTGAPEGPGTPNTQSPDSLASNQVTMRGQNMTDARARELRADSQANAGKPQIVTGANGDVFAVDPRNATGREVMGPDNKPLNKGQKLTEVQGNATAFGMRMKASNSIINKLEDSGYDTSSPKNLLAANMVTNYAASPEAQSLHQAKLNFMTASLRKESGAAINKSEFDSENRKYFAQPGDSQAVIKQKRQMRDLALKAMATQAGPGAKDFASPSVDDLVKKYAR